MSWATVQCERSKLRHVQLCSSQSALDRNTKKNPKRMLLYGRQCCMWVQTDTAEERHDQQRPAVDGVFFFLETKVKKSSCSLKHLPVQDARPIGVSNPAANRTNYCVVWCLPCHLRSFISCIAHRTYWAGLHSPMYRIQLHCTKHQCEILLACVASLLSLVEVSEATNPQLKLLFLQD